MLTEIEKKIIGALQGNIPICEKPFLELAQGLGIPEKDFLSVVRDLDQRGIIRRFGATLKHQKSGYTANAMVAWRVDETRVQEVGSIMASFDEVTHCYRRNPAATWPYNLYTMVHAFSKKECRDIVARISEAVFVDDYCLLFSKKELKKTSMKYFD